MAASEQLRQVGLTAVTRSQKGNLRKIEKNILNFFEKIDFFKKNSRKTEEIRENSRKICRAAAMARAAGATRWRPAAAGARPRVLGGRRAARLLDRVEADDSGLVRIALMAAGNM